MRPPAAPSAPPRVEHRSPLAPALAAACLALAAACSPAPPPPDSQAEREAVLAGIDRFWDAYAHQDLTVLERLYAEEAVQISAQRLEGREAILRYLRGYYKGLQIQGWSHTQNSVRISGDFALVSFWGEEAGLADGEAYRVAGWVSEVWIRRDGTWLNLQSHFGANQAPVAEESPP